MFFLVDFETMLIVWYFLFFMLLYILIFPLISSNKPEGCFTWDKKSMIHPMSLSNWIIYVFFLKPLWLASSCIYCNKRICRSNDATTNMCLFQWYLLNNAWRYKRDYQKRYLEKWQTMQWPKENGQRDKQWLTTKQCTEN